MPRKYTKGLGQITQNTPTMTDGITVVTIPSGSTKNSLLGDVGSVAAVPTTVDPMTIVDSAASAPSYHSTLFADFDLVATPTYNFYTPDETAPSSFPDEKVPLTAVPRYVTLTWDGAPLGQWFYPQISNKGFHPPIIFPKPPVMPVSSAKSSVANGYLNPGTIRATIVPPLTGALLTDANDDVFLSDPSVGSFTLRAIPSGSSMLIRASFVDPSIVGGALSEQRISVLKQPEHLLSTAALAKLGGPLEVVSQFNQDVPRRHPIPTFPASPDQTPTRYTGYVIERYDQGSDGVMRLGRTIDIDDISVGSFIDRQVAYGKRYSYRMRSILQWIRPSSIGFDGPSPIDLPPSTGSLLLTRDIASYYAGDWTDWAPTEVVDDIPPAYPDEFTVTPMSRDKILRISWKQPSDRKQDIRAIEVFRRTVGGVWESIGMFPPTNGALNDPVASGTPYVYAAVCWSVHGLVSSLSEQVQGQVTNTPSKGEVPVRQISQGGVRFGGYQTMPPPPSSSTLNAKGSMDFFCRQAESDRSLALRSYLISIRSLSTGERASITLTADATAVVGPNSDGPASVQRRKGS